MLPIAVEQGQFSICTLHQCKCMGHNPCPLEEPAMTSRPVEVTSRQQHLLHELYALFSPILADDMQATRS